MHPSDEALLDSVQTIHDMEIACLKLRGMKPVRLECIGKGTALDSHIGFC